MDFIVVLEPSAQLHEHGMGVGTIREPCVIAFQWFHETLRHTIVLWARHRGFNCVQVQIASKSSGLVGRGA